MTTISNPEGVFYHKASGRWIARIYFFKEQLTLGYFRDQDSAIAMRQEAEAEKAFVCGPDVRPDQREAHLRLFGGPVYRHLIKRQNLLDGDLAVIRGGEMPYAKLLRGGGPKKGAGRPKSSHTLFKERMYAGRDPGEVTKKGVDNVMTEDYACLR